MKCVKPNLFVLCLSLFFTYSIGAQDFQGRAEYVYKAKMNLGSWGAKMSQEQKKQIAARLKNRLEKTYILSFNKEESIYREFEKLDAMSGATDSWGKNFTPGHQYKNVKTNSFVQNQELYGKRFLIKDELLKIDWKMETETKQIGNYMCFKAITRIPSSLLSFWEFSWSELRSQSKKEESGKEGSENESPEKDEDKVEEIQMTEIVAWYTPQIPVSQGPSEFWGLPGLILELSIGDTTMLCSKIVINPKEKTKIEAPDKGDVVTKKEYKKIVFKKMNEFRGSYSGRRRS